MKMEPAGARSYEPAALLPTTTAGNCRLLMKFYQFTGDPKYLAGIPKAIEWLEKVKLPNSMNAGGRYSHPLYVDPNSNKPIFVHRKGSNVKFGYYYADSNDGNLLGHMSGKRYIDIQKLRNEYLSISASPRSSRKDSISKQTLVANSKLVTMFEDDEQELDITTAKVQEIIGKLDTQGRWLTQHVMISNRYSGEGKKAEPSDDYASTMVGDDTDTSPYRDLTDTEYISTPLYIQNMRALSQFINFAKTHTSVGN
jgi:hypothetical protein